MSTSRSTRFFSRLFLGRLLFRGLLRRHNVDGGGDHLVAVLLVSHFHTGAFFDFAFAHLGVAGNIEGHFLVFPFDLDHLPGFIPGYGP